MPTRLGAIGFVAFLWQIPPIGPVLPVDPTSNHCSVNNLRKDRLHTVEVVGSNPAVTTIESATYMFRARMSLLQVAPQVL